MTRRFFISSDQLKHPVSILTGPELNHAKNVLRLKPGDEIALFDGSGVEHKGRILSISSQEAAVEIFQRRKQAGPGSTRISIAQAFLKDKKMDLIVRQLTELGVDRLAPFFSDRSVSRPDPRRLASRRQRWEKVRIEAAKQCGRNFLLEIENAASFDEVLQLGEGADVKIIFWENASEPIKKKDFEDATGVRTVFAVVGPEGGFGEREVLRAVEHGFHPVSMGPRILRAETAALASAAVLQFIFGDMG